MLEEMTGCCLEGNLRESSLLAAWLEQIEVVSRLSWGFLQDWLGFLVEKVFGEPEVCCCNRAGAMASFEFGHHF